MHAWWLLPRLYFIHEHVKALAWWSNPNHVQATWYTLLFSIAMCMTVPASASTQSLNYICTSRAVTHHTCDLYPESTDWVTWGYQPQHYQLQLCGRRLFTPACPIHYSIRFQLLPILHKQPQLHTYLQTHYSAQLLAQGYTSTSMSSPLAWWSTPNHSQATWYVWNSKLINFGLL